MSMDTGRCSVNNKLPIFFITFILNYSPIYFDRVGIELIYTRAI
jgi:hypothetical protein